MWTRALPIAVFLAAPLVGGSAGAQAPGPEVASVRFAGVRALDPDSVRAVVATRGPRCRSALLAPACLLGDWRWAERPARVTREQLDRDEDAIEALYATHGYPGAVARAEVIAREGDGVVVRFEVREGAPQLVRSLAIRANGVPRSALPPLPLRPGVPYSIPRIQETQRRIAARLREAGHPFARVEVRGRIRGDAVDVTLSLVPGPRGVMGPARVVAEAPLSESEVRERLAFRPGDRFRPRALERTAERLQALSVVEHVSVSPAPAAPGDSSVVTRVVVETRRPTAVEADVTFGSGDCLGGYARWTARHSFGEPRVVSISAGASGVLADLLSESLCSVAGPEEFAEPSYLVGTEWREPVGPDTWLVVYGGYERRAVARAFVRRGAVARTGLAHDFGGGWSASLAYAPEWIVVEAVRPMHCAQSGWCTGPLPGALGGTPRIAPLELSAAWAPREAARRRLGPLEAPGWMLPLAPRWLFGAHASLAVAGPITASELGYARLSAEGSLTRLLGRRVELAGRLRLGVVRSGEGPVPPQLRFYGGGPPGVRGVAPSLLGPGYLLPRSPAELPCVLRAGACAGAVLDAEDVFLRPFGGDAVLEAGLEGRIWAADWLQLAAFVDAGRIWSSASPGSAASGGLLTPGVGVLALSPAGPVRVDIAYRPPDEPFYPLVAPRPDGEGYVHLGPVGLERRGAVGPEETLRRLRVHLYLGLPF